MLIGVVVIVAVSGTFIKPFGLHYHMIACFILGLFNGWICYRLGEKLSGESQE